MMFELILAAAFLAGLGLLLTYYLIRRDGDDETPAPPRNEEQGWAEDEAWDSKRIVR